MSTAVESSSRRWNWPWTIMVCSLIVIVIAAATETLRLWFWPAFLLLCAACIPSALRWQRLIWLLLPFVPILVLLGGELPVVLAALIMGGLMSTAMYGLGGAVLPCRGPFRVMAGILAVLFLCWLMIVCIGPVPTYRPQSQFDEVAKRFNESLREKAAGDVGQHVEEREQ